MLAVRLAGSGVASTLINRSPDFGLGVAYATPFDGHLLNVRTSRMSAVEARPDDFLDWVRERHPACADPDGFAPRRLFGLYVQDRLAAAEAAHPGRIERIVGEVVALEVEAVRLADGRVVTAGAVVLATGNPAPRTAAGGAANDRVLSDPWAPGTLSRIGAGEDILIIGTGLTMVDMLLQLTAGGWRGRATALSRRGLLPRAHRVHHEVPIAPTPGMVAGPASRRLGDGRRLAGSGGWRSMMDGLRPVTADLWRETDPAVRARLVRHLRPWWDVHRHRLAPVVAGAIDGLVADGRLQVVAGRVRRIAPVGDAVSLHWMPRHATMGETLTGGWLIDCTGPGHDPARDPLTGPLISNGRARLDALGLGLDLDGDGRVLGADGRPDSRLFVLGPPARAAFWETIAVPDIRQRVEAVAAALTA
ncbi:MAG: putative NAD(P)/FAD-binding protein YdhS [Brevundimonas sp.]|jgi:uncharacterized NAD(P)/FAD-binding protein YdhS